MIDAESWARWEAILEDDKPKLWEIVLDKVACWVTFLMMGSFMAFCIAAASVDRQSSKPMDAFPVGTTVAFVSEPDVPVGHVVGYYDGGILSPDWWLRIRILATKDIILSAQKELVVKNSR